MKAQMAEEETRGPLDTEEARKERKENVERRKVGRQEADQKLEKERWQEDFQTAYQSALKRNWSMTGRRGH